MSSVDMASALDTFFDAIASKQGGYIACTCTHGIVEADTDARLRDVLNHSLLTLPDGMPTVWMGRLQLMPVRRVTAPDFMAKALTDVRAKRVRHYFYGASEATLRQILSRASHAAGARAIVGGYSPPLRPAGTPEDDDVLAAIAAARPDVIWVGLGLPKQEYWMAQYRDRFPSSVLVGVGAAFDWYSGNKQRAPWAVQVLGLEWLHRLACEPRRLWPRYSVVVPKALAIMMRDTAALLSPHK